MNTNDYFELLAMHKILLEAKFNKEPGNMYVQISPHTAKFSNQVVDRLIKLAKEQGNNAEVDDWNEWRKFSTRSIEKSIIEKQFEYFGNDLSDFNEDDKVEVIRDLSAPFILTKDEEQELLDLLNSKI